MRSSLIVSRVAWLVRGLTLVIAVLLCAREASAQAQGALVIVTDPPGQEITIDGERAGTSPVKRSLMPGDHLIEARLPQGKVSRVVKVAAGESTVVNLAATPAAPPPAGTSAGTAPPPATPPGAAPPPATPPPATTPPAEADKVPAADASAPAPPPPGPVNRIEGDVLSPTHPHQRFGWGAGAGIGLHCSGVTLKRYDYVAGASVKHDVGGCGFVLHLVPFDFSFGEMNLELLAGGAGSLGLAGGFAIGSPWFRVGPATSPVVMTVRARVAYVWQQFSYTTGLFSQFTSDFGSIQGGVHVAASYPLTRLLTVDATVAGGPQWAYPQGYESEFGWFLQFTGGIRL